MTPTGAPPAPSPADPLLGQTLGGTYRLDARLGAGAMGTVYRAHHLLLDQDFAVKVLATDVADDPDVRRRFLVEARSLAAFTHKHAVQVRHCGEDRGVLYLAMDLVRGETLADLLAREGPLPAARAGAIVVQVLDALAEAHAAGIVHRDLKPGNVMVETTRGPDGTAVDRVRVVDFGLARIVDVERSALPSAYASFGGTVVGTVAYMAPEQLRAEDDVDGRADQFAVGVVLYELLTGAAPFPGTSTMSIALRVVEHPPAPWPPAVTDAVPATLRAVVERALAKAPGDRFPTAGAMADAIRAVLAAAVDARSAPTAPAPTAPGLASASVARAAVRSRPRRTLALVVALALAGGGAAWRLLHPPAPSAAETAARARARGDEALATGRFSEAIDAFGAAIAADPTDGVAWLGRAEARTGLLDRNARADLDEAARLRPDDVAVLVARARYFQRVEHDRAAVDKAVVAALTLDGGAVDARVERAEASLAAGDLERADLDVGEIERGAPEDARGPALRARLLVARTERADAPADRRRAWLDDAVAAGRRAAALDPTWGAGATALAVALQSQGNEAKARGDYDAARAAYADAEAAATEALRRVRAFPARRRQGASVLAALHGRAGIRFLALDVAGAAADLEEAVRLAPRDAELLSTLAYARQQAGDHEKAIEVYARLYGITGEKDHVFRQAFGWQRVGDDRADVGDVTGARAAYDRALEVYGAALARFPDANDLLAYRGETWVRRARLARGAARDRDLASAAADLDRALAVKPGDSETLLRRGEWALAAQRPADALADLRAAIGDRMDRTPRFYARLAAAALERGAASRDGADADAAATARALATTAVDAATRAVDLLPALAPLVLPLRASAHVRVATWSDDPAAREAAFAAAEADLARVEASPTDTPGGAVRARATAAHGRAELLLARGDATGALTMASAAVATRDAEAAAGRWSLDARWVERLADALAATGDTDGAAAARARAASLPR